MSIGSQIDKIEAALEEGKTVVRVDDYWFDKPVDFIDEDELYNFPYRFDVLEDEDDSGSSDW